MVFNEPWSACAWLGLDTEAARTILRDPRSSPQLARADYLRCAIYARLTGTPHFFTERGNPRPIAVATRHVVATRGGSQHVPDLLNRVH
jgi:hypothetical protein